MSSEAQKIVKLDESVVNRIAAGEIIQNASNCVKELIENSIDAKATKIQVTTKYGGLKSIQIADNGTGILKENLEILCERFTTSKLKEYEDLKKMSTYGFRGEALASISMISRLTVQTKTRDQVVAYKAKYENGVMLGEPTAVAGNQGTVITIEDLFYNVPVRAKTMTLSTEQFMKIFDVVSKYAVHNHNISMTLKKHDENNTIKTQPSDTPVNNIRIIFGNEVANSLLKVAIDNVGLKFKMDGYVTNAEYSGKKGQFVLFINHRLVESKALKRALFEDVYKKVLPEKSNPFIYMSLSIAAENIDVNISPTKHEVSFLNEDAIVESIRSVVEETLLRKNETRKLYTQQLLPGAAKVTFETSMEGKEKIYAKDMIRTDSKSQSIIKFLSQSIDDENQGDKSNSQILASNSPSLKKKLKAKGEGTRLMSVRLLVSEIEMQSSENLTEQVRNMKFVGNVDRSRSLVQCENMLYLVDSKSLARHLFYQLVLKNFSNFNIIEFEAPLNVSELVSIAASMKESQIDVDHVLTVLSQNAEMYKEYFQISINEKGELESLPILMEDYAPLMAHLPNFLVRLATKVNYESELECFRNISKELATFYSNWSLVNGDKEYNHLMEHIIFPKIQSALMPPETMENDGTFLKMTSLQDLYKVFERC